MVDVTPAGLEATIYAYGCYQGEGYEACEEREQLEADVKLLREAFRAIDKADTDEEALGVIFDVIRQLAGVESGDAPDRRLAGRPS